MDYKQKYLKYKEKYLRLKAEMSGGLITSDMIPDNNPLYRTEYLNNDKYFIALRRDNSDNFKKFDRLFISRQFGINDNNPEKKVINTLENTFKKNFKNLQWNVLNNDINNPTLQMYGNYIAHYYVKKKNIGRNKNYEELDFGFFTEHSTSVFDYIVIEAISK